MTQTSRATKNLIHDSRLSLASLFNLVWLTSRWRMSPKDVETSTPLTSLDLTVQRGQRTLTRSQRQKLLHLQELLKKTTH
jgi:hypothetical protein